MERAPSSTKDALLDAAEREFATKGVDGAELDAIRIAAGQRNRSAIAYHFGGRDGLIRAVSARRRVPVDAARTRMLDRLERSGQVDLADLARAVVRPAVAHFADQHGRDYLRIVSEQMSRHGVKYIFTVADDPAVGSVRRLNDLLFERMSGTAPMRRRRIGQAWLSGFVLMSDIARDLEAESFGIEVAKQRAREIERIVAAVLRTG